MNDFSQAVMNEWVACCGANRHLPYANVLLASTIDPNAPEQGIRTNLYQPQIDQIVSTLMNGSQLAQLVGPTGSPIYTTSSGYLGVYIGSSQLASISTPIVNAIETQAATIIGLLRQIEQNTR